MVARGDLGVELPIEEVPLVQKQLVRRALDRGVPSIVATQMLESMTTSPRPTRAEASDVANAVFDGADAILLSGETAIGAYPLRAADVAVRIARFCEEHGATLLPPGRSISREGGDVALAGAAVALATADPAITSIACYTRTGRTAAILSSLRPRVPVFAFSAEPAVVRRLALVSGVTPRLCDPITDEVDSPAFLVDLLARNRLVQGGASAVLVASTTQAATAPNLLAVHEVPAGLASG